MNIFLITEAIAVVALCFNIFAYRQQHIQRYRVYSGIAMLLLSIHFFLLGAYAASIGCGLAMIRNIVSLRWNGWRTTLFFISTYLLFFIYEWFVLKHGSEILLAYSASIIFTIGTLRLSNTEQLKKLLFSAEGLSIIYCILVGSIFGTIYGLFNVAVIIHWWLTHNSPVKDQPIKHGQ